MILGEAIGVARASPVGDFVNSAVVAFRFAEALGHERAVTVLGEPAGGQFAQCEAKALGGEIGSAGFADDEKAPQLHKEFEPLGAGDRVPANQGVPVLEMPDGGAPDEHGDDPVFFESELTEPVSRLAARSEQVLFIKHGMGELPVGGSFCGGNVERSSAWRGIRDGGRADFHDTSPTQHFLCPSV